MPAVLWGVAFGNIVRGVDIDEDKEYVGSFFDLLNPYALLGGLVTLSLFVTHGAVFVSLKTVGDIRVRARAHRPAGRARRRRRRRDVPRRGRSPQRSGAAHRGWFAALAVLAAVSLVGGLLAIRAGREGWAFLATAATFALAVASLFVVALPRGDALVARPGVLAHHHERVEHPVHAEAS